jgi:putative DNA primase/helicase
MARKPKAKSATATPANPVMAAQTEPVENTLEPSHVPEKPAAKSKRGQNAKPREAPSVDDGESGAPRAPPGKRTPDIPPVPQDIRERFIGIGSDYYFPDGAPAFKDHGAKLTTPSENTEVIRSMVTIAQSRGWNDITVKGTERFRKDAWFAAQLVGISVRGYEPSAFEREHIVRAISRRAAGAAGRATDTDPIRDGATPGASKAPSHPTRYDDAATGDDTPPRASRNARASSPRQPESESTSMNGRLVDHGRAPYRHDPKESMSYFVRLETARGDIEIWGVDLERASRESLTRPTMGDEVTVRATGRERVKVPVEVKDDQGRVIGKDRDRDAPQSLDRRAQ